MKLFVQRDKEFRSALYDIMGFYPHNVELYRIAFAHKSQEYKSKKTGDRPLNNERLEFLGDAVLETVVSDIVYHHFKNKREGFLTNTRSKIVSRESLGKLAKDLGIDRLIQSHTNSKAHNSFLAGNAFEALMGAIYLDRGFDYAFRFIEHRIMGSVLDLEGVAHKEVNFKSKLLEWSQKNRIRIDFKDKQIDASSSNTPSFSTTIVLEGLFAGDGKGFSKKEAHQNAAKDALTRMRREPKFIDDIFSSKEKRTAMEADPCFVLPVIDEIEAEIARENDNKSRRKEQQKKEQPAKPEAKKDQPKKEQPAKKDKEKAKKEQTPKEQPKEQPAPAKPEAKKEQPKEQPAKPEPKKEQAKEQQAKEQPKEQAAKTEPIAPIVIPIAFEDILNDTPADKAPSQNTTTPEAPTANEVPAETEAPTADQHEAATKQHEAAAEQPMAVADQHETAAEQPKSVAEQPEAVAKQAEVSADDAAPAPAEPAAAKKPRRRGRRQNAAGFTNTDIIPAETSHRAEKAAKKVEEAKKEKARKAAKKSARKAAKGIDDAEAPAQNAVNNGKNGAENNAAESNAAESNAAEKSAANAPKGASNRKKQPKGNGEKADADDAAKQEKPAAKKPRRRRKTKAELPSETPNPEREQAIAAAEAAAYQQPNED